MRPGPRAFATGSLGQRFSLARFRAAQAQEVVADLGRDPLGRSTTGLGGFPPVRSGWELVEADTTVAPLTTLLGPSEGPLRGRVVEDGSRLGWMFRPSECPHQLVSDRAEREDQPSQAELARKRGHKSGGRQVMLSIRPALNQPIR